MKFVKKAIAMLLCFAVVLSANLFCAYADSEQDDSQYIEISPENLLDVGTLVEGNNDFNYSRIQYRVGELSVHEKGFYRFGQDFNNDIIVTYKKDPSETRYKKVESETYKKNGYTYIRLEPGTFNIIFECKTLTISSLGEFIELTYKKEAFRQAVYGIDFQAKLGENMLFNAHPEAVFEKESIDLGYICLTFTNEMVFGENEVSFVLGGQEFTETLELVQVTDIVSGISFDDESNSTNAKIYYDGIEVNFPETITVNFADGTYSTHDLSDDDKYEACYHNIKFPNGRNYSFKAEFKFNKENNKYENCRFIFWCGSGENIIAEKAVTATPTSAKENIDRFFDEAASSLRLIGFYNFIFQLWDLSYVFNDLLMYLLDLSLGNV